MSMTRYWWTLFICQRSIWREKVGIEHLKNPKVFVDYSLITDNV